MPIAPVLLNLWLVCAGEPLQAAPQPTLTVLSLNLMQKASAPRKERLAKLADALAKEPPDFLLLQEGSGGLWDGTQNSIGDLAGLLDGRGLRYTHVSRDSLGVAGFLVFKVAVASRRPMAFTDAACLGEPGGDWFDKSPLPGRKNAVAAGADVPGFGKVNVVSVHLFTGSDKGAQVEALLAFVRELDAKHPAAVTVVGGDFNFADSHPAYAQMVSAGFTDAGKDAGPTFGLPENPLRKAKKPSRIDYIFVKGKAKVTRAEVKFNREGQWVSDHCGVLTHVTPAEPAKQHVK